jgi:hypothetical protein
MANTTNTNVTNANDLLGLLVNARQDAIFAGYESSLYLPGVIMNVHNVPNGSVTAQIPKFAAVATSNVSTEGHDETTGTIEELEVTNVANAAVNVTAKSYAARALLKDLGGLDASSVGTVLGRAVSEKFDDDVAALFSGEYASPITNEAGATTTALTIDKLATAAQTVRAAKFAGQLNCVLHPAQIEDILQDLTTSSFAGSDALNEALRQGMVGSLFGMNIWQSASVGTDNSAADYAGCVWAENAFGIAMFKGLDVMSQSNITGLGTDIVASLHATPAIVDITRACRVISAV